MHRCTAHSIPAVPARRQLLLARPIPHLGEQGGHVHRVHGAPMLRAQLRHLLQAAACGDGAGQGRARQGQGGWAAAPPEAAPSALARAAVGAVAAPPTLLLLLLLLLELQLLLLLELRLLLFLVPQLLLLPQVLLLLLPPQLLQPLLLQPLLLLLPHPPLLPPFAPLLLQQRLLVLLVLSALVAGRWWCNVAGRQGRGKGWQQAMRGSGSHCYGRAGHVWRSTHGTSRLPLKQDACPQLVCSPAALTAWHAWRPQHAQVRSPAGMRGRLLLVVVLVMMVLLHGLLLLLLRGLLGAHMRVLQREGAQRGGGAWLRGTCGRRGRPAGL